MFILRRITSEHTEINSVLGESYNLVRRDQTKDFSDTSDAFFNNARCMGDTDQMVGFIVYENGQKIMPLYEKSSYFIMTSDGKTFDNLKRIM